MKNFFAFNSFYYLRRFLLGITIIYSDKQLIWQLFSMVFQFTFMLILLGNEPLKSKGNNRFELFNECMIMIIMYQILCFSDAMPDPETQKIMGISCMTTICIHIIFDLSLLMYQTMRSVKIRIKVRRMKKQLK